MSPHNLNLLEQDPNSTASALAQALAQAEASGNSNAAAQALASAVAQVRSFYFQNHGIAALLSTFEKMPLMLLSYTHVSKKLTLKMHDSLKIQGQGSALAVSQALAQAVATGGCGAVANVGFSPPV